MFHLSNSQNCESGKSALWEEGGITFSVEHVDYVLSKCSILEPLKAQYLDDFVGQSIRFRLSLCMS
jgi:hypothetical protein